MESEADKGQPTRSISATKQGVLPIALSTLKMEAKIVDRISSVTCAITESSEAINEIKTRMTTLEGSVRKLVALSTQTQLESGSPRGQKRARTKAFDENTSHSATTSRACSPFVTTGSESHATPPFSAYEARTLIQEELCRVPRSNTSKHIALQSALTAIKQNLNTNLINHDSSISVAHEHPVTEFPTPPISLMQWMLRSEDSGRSVCSGSGFMPFISRNSVGKMVRSIFEKPFDERDRASLICVSSYAGYFLQEIVLSDHRKYTGLETELRDQAQECFATVRAASSSYLTQAPSSLENLQALTFAIMLAQEIGDFVAAWLLTEAASRICIDLKLHKKVNAFSNTSEIAMEAYFCFSTCYKADKGLAMNLARPAFLQDSEIEIDILRPPNSKIDVVDNFESILSLLKFKAKLSRFQDKVKHEKAAKYDSELESTMVDFAFYSVKTVIFHSGVERLRHAEYNQSCLEAARLALNAVQKARELSHLSQYNSTYMRTSFLHWTILHYPFTPFFVLLCNVISTRHLPDYQMMREFVAYLYEAKDIVRIPLLLLHLDCFPYYFIITDINSIHSVSASKLHKLCLPFCSLASRLLNSEEVTSPPQQSRLSHAYPQQPINYSPWQNPPSQPESPQQPPSYQNLQSVSYQVPTTLPNLSTTCQPWGIIQEPNAHLLGDQETWWDFMDTQPVLQWLDSDFSALEDDWVTRMNALP
ncbi:hypothetical protein G7Y89_g4977 [Cudoniella acicularis]|uniref:Xylanolytic transcriptional activator regulatory domain-containing protein n=1 Tax=Cudoniella acicularis TaxID=354080 RepID=A0A8H4RND0_9HELO|nr:hypothetical protein G7Y89_g4977 [Cudoniella acicularis]